MKRRKITFFVFVFFLIAFTGSGLAANYFVKIYRSNYKTNLEPTKFAEYKNKQLSFYSIGIEDQNLTNFNFYSEDEEITYELYYSWNRGIQPVSSFFWYALEKTWRTLGIDVTPDGPLNDVPVLVLTFIHLNDQEATFRIDLSRNEKQLLKKNISVSQRLSPTRDAAVLEKRAYAFLDLMAEAVLNDPDFKREFFLDKEKIASEASSKPEQ